MKKPGKKRLILLLLVLAALLAGWTGWELWRSKNGLCVSRYEIETDQLTAPVRIVQLSDLHNSVFGDGNRRLLALVAEQEPDLIVATGDLLNRKEENTDTAVSLLAALTQIAPVYVSMGNHELDYQARFGTDIAALYSSTGATVLEYSYEDIQVNGQNLRLGGIYGYCLPEKYLATGEAWPEECAFLREFQDTGDLTVLLCHMPVCWIINGSLDEWNVDCVFAGHAHGGQIRLPFGGSLYAPDQGWFPGRLWGVFSSAGGEKHLVLSRGLGSTETVPRFCNVPEVVVVDLLPE